MALDTKTKRWSAVGVGRPWMRSTFPTDIPTEGWRLSVGNAYAGNALTPAVAGPLLMIQHIQNFNRQLIGGMRA